MWPISHSSSLNSCGSVGLWMFVCCSSNGLSRPRPLCARCTTPPPQKKRQTRISLRHTTPAHLEELDPHVRHSHCQLVVKANPTFRHGPTNGFEAEFEGGRISGFGGEGRMNPKKKRKERKIRHNDERNKHNNETGLKINPLHCSSLTLSDHTQTHTPSASSSSSHQDNRTRPQQL